MIISLNTKWRMQWDGLQFNIETHSSDAAKWKADYHYRDPWRAVLFVLEKELESIPRRYSPEAVEKLIAAANRIGVIGAGAETTLKLCLGASESGEKRKATQKPPRTAPQI